MQQPNNVTFFVESREEAAEAMKVEGIGSRGAFFLDRIASGDCLRAVQGVRGRVAVALNDAELQTDGALVEFLRTLNRARIPVDAWVNLPEGDYWMHAGNIPEAWRHIYAVVNTLDRLHVGVENVGLDLEFPSRFMVPSFNADAYFATKPWTFDRAQAHDQLVKEADRFLSGGKRGLHAYEIPIMSDLKVVEWALGMVAAPTTEEIVDERYRRVALTYSSSTPVLPAKPLIDWFAHGKKRIPALGIISGTNRNPGRDMSFEKLLTERQFARDVRYAMAGANQFFVFALNGQRVVDQTQEAIRQALLPVK